MSSRSATVAAIVAAAGLALLVSACGRSPAGHVAQLGTTTTHDASNSSAPPAQQTGPLAFARCMRSNSVPNWPDPNGDGAFDKSKLTSQHLGATDSQVQAAQRVCNHLLPNGGRGPSAAQVQQIRAQALRFSHCVRAHGVPNFPDPDSTGRIPDPASGGIDQGSPKFRAANTACGRYRPPYMPSNAAYDAYARTHG